MPDHVYQIIEVVGSSKIGIDDAIRTAIAKAGETIQHMNWFQVMETRGHITDGQVGHFQVVLKVGYRLEN